jgi:hypothetical protein
VRRNVTQHRSNRSRLRGAEREKAFYGKSHLLSDPSKSRMVTLLPVCSIREDCLLVAQN